MLYVSQLVNQSVCNNDDHDNDDGYVYGAVTMAQPSQKFTQFTWLL